MGFAVLVRFSLHLADQAGTLNDHPINCVASVSHHTVASDQFNSLTYNNLR
jgi:hypothetical protein